MFILYNLILSISLRSSLYSNTSCIHQFRCYQGVLKHKRISRIKVIKKTGQIPRSRLPGKKCWYPWNGPITGNTHVKYQCSFIQYLKVISKVNISKKKKIKLQGQGHGVKDVGTNEKVLLLEILMWNINALTLIIQKLLARLTFSKNGSRSR